MPTRQLVQFLDKHHVPYEIFKHSVAYTAPEIAASAHVPGKELAKSVIVKVDGKLAMVVEPAHRRVNLAELKEFTGAKEVELASEYEFEDRFPDCEIGAMPATGNIYNMDVFIDKELTEDEEIVFNAGNHEELVKMAYRDFANIVKPKIIKSY